MKERSKMTLIKEWKDLMIDEFHKPYMKELSEFLLSEELAGKEIYPPRHLILNALNSTPVSAVKVVILGQDPYHGEGQAHGLSFSVNKGVDIPPSLRNIFKELKADLKIETPSHGCLTSWAKQGVLLLNTALTVEKAHAGSHSKKGWSTFTDKIITTVSEQCDNVVFMLWGAHAQSKVDLIDENKHLILKTSHPSPLSVHRGFLGCGHFSKCNEYLQANGKSGVNWDLPKRELEQDQSPEP